MTRFAADLEHLGRHLRQAVEHLHGRELADLDPWERVGGVGAVLGCLVCPSPASLRIYGGWESLLHEIGHFAIAPRFLWDVPAYVDALDAGRRPELPRVADFAVALTPQGALAPWGYVSDDDTWIENPHPLTDWHVRAWQWWACRALQLPEPSRLWLQSAPWWDLLSRAEMDHSQMERPRRWCDRHPIRTGIWRERASTQLHPEQELAWRLADVFHAPWLNPAPTPAEGCAPFGPEARTDR